MDDLNNICLMTQETFMRKYFCSRRRRFGCAMIKALQIEEFL